MINRTIMVTMQRQRTFGTIEMPLAKRHIHNSSTSTAPLAAAPSLWVFQELSTACYSFVGQHLNEITPSSIAYGFGETMISNHIADVKVLAKDKPVFCGEHPANLMVKVIALVKDFKMLFSQSKIGFPSIVRAKLLARNSSLQKLNFFLTLDQIFRIRYNLTIGQSGKVLQANINSYVEIGRMNYINFRHFASEVGKPLVCLVDFDSQSLDFAFGNTMQYDWQVANLREFEPSITENLETRFRISNAEHFALEAGKTLLSGVFLDTPKEVSKSLANPVRDILQDMNMDLRIILRASKLDVCYELIKLELVRGIKFFVKVKKSVIDFLANLEVFDKPYFLLCRWIDAIFVTKHKRYYL